MPAVSVKGHWNGQVLQFVAWFVQHPRKPENAEMRSFSWVWRHEPWFLSTMSTTSAPVELRIASTCNNQTKWRYPTSLKISLKISSARNSLEDQSHVQIEPPLKRRSPRSSSVLNLSASSRSEAWSRDGVSVPVAKTFKMMKNCFASGLNMTEYDWMFLQLETSSWESDSTDHSAPQFPWVHRTNATSPCCADSLFAKHRTVETIDHSDHSDHSTPRFLQTEDVLHETFGPAFPHWNVTMSPLSSNSFSVQFLRTCPLLLEDLVGWESHAGHAIQNSWNAEWFQTGFNRFGLSNSPTNMPHSRRKWSAARQKEETQTWTSAKERCWKFSLLRLFQFEQIITKNLHALMSSTQSHNCSK